MHVIINIHSLASSLLSLALDPSIELPIERAFAHLYCVTVPLLIEFITGTELRRVELLGTEVIRSRLPSGNTC